MVNNVKGFPERSGTKKDVHVAIGGFFAMGKEAKQPCLQDGLGLEVVGDYFYHCLGFHRLEGMVAGGKGNDNKREVKKVLCEK